LSGKNVLILGFFYPPTPDPSYPNGMRNDGNASDASAQELRRWYQSMGASAHYLKVADTPDSLIAQLQGPQNRGKKYDRIILIAHGGVDGPIFAKYWDQIGLNWPNLPSDWAGHNHYGWGPPPDETILSNRQALVDLANLLASVTNLDASIFVGACHSAAGSNGTNIDPGSYTYIGLMACLTGRAVWGTSNTTAFDLVWRQVEDLDGPSHLVEPDLVRAEPATSASKDSRFVCAYGGSPAQVSP
jgi:hypothetical protein